MSNKSPAYQWYPKDILASARVAEMSLAEEGAYRRLLDFCWLNGSIPNDAKRVARIIGKGASVEIAQNCMEMFVVCEADDSRLIHDRLEIEREKQEHNSEARKRASEARWSKQGTSANGRGKQVNTDRKPNDIQSESKCNANAMQMQSSSIPTSTSTSKNVFSDEKTKSKGGGGGGHQSAPEQPPPAAAEFSTNDGKPETLQDYLLRKQLEFPQHDVNKVYADFKSKCGSPQYPKLKNTKRNFDNWILKQDEELSGEITVGGNTDIVSKRAAIAACSLCDSNGYLKVDGRVKVCKHELNGGKN